MPSSHTRFAAFSLILAISASLPACKSTQKRSAAKEITAAERELGITHPCIKNSFLPEDGYSELAAVDPTKVHRKVLTASGPVEDPVKTISPTVGEINNTMIAISAYIDRTYKIPPGRDLRRRTETYRQTGGSPEPYCLFHTPGQPIYGTVILFHGFNDRPQQQAALGSYLFHSGFNVYNVFLVNHWLVEGTGA